MFVSKLTPAGSALVYSTYLDGSVFPLGLWDHAAGIAIDSTGNAYVTGSTRSADFPTVNPVQTPLAGFAFRSVDGGNFWNGISPINAALEPSGPLSTLLVDPQTPSNLYALLEGQLYRSTNRGTAWQNVSSPQSNFVALAVVPTTPAILYALYYGATASPSGLYQSLDRGTSWTPVNTVDDLVYGGARLVAAPANPATLYVYTHSGVRRSVNGGNTWSPWVYPSFGGGGVQISWIAVDPTNPLRLYAATSSLAISPQTGLYISTNGGNTWVQTTLNVPLLTVAVDPTNPATLYAGGGPAQGGLRVYKSTDSGTTWTLLNLATPSVAWVETLVVDPTNPATVYAGTGYSSSYNGPGLYKSLDGGATWKLVGLQRTDISIVTLDPTSPGTVYAGSSSSGSMSSNAFVTELDATGSTRLFSTTLGGTGDDVATGIALGPTGAIYLTGRVGSNDFPTVNPLQGLPGGQGDVLLARISLRPTVSIAATTPLTTKGGSIPGAFTVTRAGSSTDPLTVNYTVSGTALPVTDYSGSATTFVPLSGSVTIPAGASSAVINVYPANDGVPSPQRTVIVTLSPSPNYGLASSRDTVTITDNPGVRLFVVDPNNGTVLGPRAVETDFAGWGAEARAQVVAIPGASYSWDLTQAPEATGVTGQGTWDLTWSWAAFQGAPRDEIIVLTVTPSTGPASRQQLRYRLTGTDSPAWVTAASRPTTTATWPVVVPPDTLSTAFRKSFGSFP
jgi:hypothetical protein